MEYRLRLLGTPRASPPAADSDATRSNPAPTGPKGPAAGGACDAGGSGGEGGGAAWCDVAAEAGAGSAGLYDVVIGAGLGAGEYLLELRADGRQVRSVALDLRFLSTNIDAVQTANFAVASRVSPTRSRRALCARPASHGRKGCLHSRIIYHHQLCRLAYIGALRR